MFRTNFHGPKDVRAIEVRLYNQNHCDEAKQTVQWRSEARTQENNKEIRNKLDEVNVLAFIFYFYLLPFFPSNYYLFSSTDACKVLCSKKRPLWLTWRNSSPDAENTDMQKMHFIFKHGDGMSHPFIHYLPVCCQMLHIFLCTYSDN